MNSRVKSPQPTTDQRLLRDRIGREIDRLIAMLDAMDGDENIEETGDEHDNGMPDRWVRSYLFVGDEGDNRPFVAQSEDDEDSNDAEQDDSDSEPALGWTDASDQTQSNSKHATSYEDEPELGWRGNGIGWEAGESLDEGDEEREDDPAECGIADRDGTCDTFPGGYPSAMELKWDGKGTGDAVAMLRAAGLKMHVADGIAITSPIQIVLSQDREAR